MTKRVTIDADQCVACGTSVEICPEVFALEERAETATVIKETEGPEEAIQEAVDTCPVQCISWRDE